MNKFWAGIFAFSILCVTFGLFDVIRFIFLIIGASVLLFLLILTGLLIWLMRKKKRLVRKKTIEVDGEQVEAEFQQPKKY